MGEQIHIGGLSSSMDLAERAAIDEGSNGVDLCCCNGAGMRFLVRFRKVAHMTGVDATERVVERGRQRTEDEGLADRVDFVVGDATETGLPDATADFVWGEDAWCYVEDKAKLIAEAARLIRPGGKVAFTDWVAGPEPMSNDESERYLSFMKFPNVLDFGEYRSLLEECGCRVEMAEDTGRFPSHVDLYLNMLNMQLAYDALKIIGLRHGAHAVARWRNGLRPATRARGQDLSRQVRSQQGLNRFLRTRVRPGWCVASLAVRRLRARRVAPAGVHTPGAGARTNQPAHGHVSPLEAPLGCRAGR
jgi:ubiquinone/menaquinone biosynthesis C-methylase UbiE